MRKETLRSLKRINATPKMVQMAKNNNKRMEYRSWNNRKKIIPTEYDLLVRCQTRGKILMICVFHPEMLAAGNLAPLYEIYCNPEGDEYITRVLNETDGTETKWSTAMFDNLQHVFHSYWNDYYYLKREDRDKRIWQNPEGRDTIQSFLKTKEKGVRGLMEWQRKVKAKKIAEAEAREKAPWDADMKLVPKIMPYFVGWMKKEAARKYFIIYEYKGKEADEGYCSYCQKFVPVTKPRHGREGKCQRCGKNITFKAAGKIKTLSTGWYSAQCIQKIAGGIVVREFEQFQGYNGKPYTDPDIFTKETKRVLIMDNGTVKRYVYDLYKNKEHRFIPDKYGYTSYSITKVYAGNIAALKKTALKNSAIDLWMKRSKIRAIPAGAMEYLAAEKGNPAIEKLARIGMFRLAEDMMHISYGDGRQMINQKATELIKMLKIDKARLKRLQAIDGGIEHLRWYQKEKDLDTIWPDALIKDFGDAEFHNCEFHFLDLPLSYVKIWNYLKRQQDITGETLYQIKDTWMDYLNMAEQAKMDVKNERIWKPKDLQAAHDEVVILLQKEEMEKEAKKLEKKWPKVNGNLPKLKKFEYSDGKYSIVVPESILDIVKEGRILKHCVDTCDFYYDRIQKDETYLFFLRHAEHEDIPWYTLEVEPSGNIRQKRTTGDNQNKDFEEAVEFLKKWQKVFVKRLTKEEKEAGKKADQARIREYEELRKNGNRVWHGKLAGQLLADVLEADFMAVAT